MPTFHVAKKIQFIDLEAKTLVMLFVIFFLILCYQNTRLPYYKHGAIYKYKNSYILQSANRIKMRSSQDQYVTQQD